MNRSFANVASRSRAIGVNPNIIDNSAASAGKRTRWLRHGYPRSFPEPTLITRVARHSALRSVERVGCVWATFDSSRNCSVSRCECLANTRRHFSARARLRVFNQHTTHLEDSRSEPRSVEAQRTRKGHTMKARPRGAPCADWWSRARTRTTISTKAQRQWNTKKNETRARRRVFSEGEGPGPSRDRKKAATRQACGRGAARMLERAGAYVERHYRKP